MPKLERELKLENQVHGRATIYHIHVRVYHLSSAWTRHFIYLFSKLSKDIYKHKKFYLGFYDYASFYYLSKVETLSWINGGALPRAGF